MNGFLRSNKRMGGLISPFITRRNISLGIDINSTEATCCLLSKKDSVEPQHLPSLVSKINISDVYKGKWNYPREPTIPTEPLRLIVNDMIQNAKNKAKDEPLESIVLTIPTGFTELQKQRVLESWKKANIPPFRKMIMDASAPALSFAYLYPESEGKLITIHLDDSSFSLAIAEVVYGVADIEEIDGVIHYRKQDMKEDNYIELLTKAVVERVRKSMENVSVTSSDISHILLSGNLLSNHSQIKDAILRIFGNQAQEKLIKIDNALAAGAAIQAGILDGTVGNLILLNALPQPINVAVKGGSYIPLANKNSVYPLTHVKKFKISEEQPHIHINIFQGTSLIGQLTLDNIQKDTEFDILLDVDANGNMAASALNTSTNETFNIPLDGTSLGEHVHTCEPNLTFVKQQPQE